MCADNTHFKTPTHAYTHQVDFIKYLPLTSKRGFLDPVTPTPSLGFITDGSLISVSNLGTIVKQDVGNRGGR